MLLGEPPDTPYDLRFRLGSIPVRIHPLFWFVTVLLGVPASSGDPALIGLWVAAVFVSIVTHEFGHAWAARAHGWAPRITLYGMGGLASYRPTRQTRRSRILIALAGPGAGFVFAGLIIASLMLVGFQVALTPLPVELGSGSVIPGRLGAFVAFLVFVNVFWGLINLVPIQPLDGGQALLAALGTRRDAWSLALKISVGCSFGIALLGALWFGSMFIAIAFAIIGFQNLQMLRQAEA